MCLFKWFKKKQPVPTEKAATKPEETITPVKPATPEKTPEPVIKEQPIAVPKPELEPQPKAAPQPEPKIVPEPEPKVQAAPQSEPKPEPKEDEKPTPAPAETPTEKNDSRYQGKYEIFPEAGFFKYRLKASNGEILIVSQSYVSKTGAQSGIETLKRNVAGGNFEVYTDKNNYSQFLLNSTAGRRLIAVGEFYDSKKRCESAIESVKRFYNTEKVVILDEIPPEEIREELVDIKPVEPNPNGKFELYEESGQWLFRLKAANSEVLFVSQGYAAKANAINGLETIKKAVENANFRVSKDKQGRFQFKLYSTNNQLILTGETYMDKDTCISAIGSVRKYSPLAKTVEIKSE